MSSFKLLHLILKSNNPNKIIRHILDFFNLKINDSLLNEFNLIRFVGGPVTPTAVQPQLRQTTANPIKAPACSILLFSSNCPDNDEQTSPLKGWKYHHKLELKDERQHVIARQTFYEHSTDMPLFCMSSIRKDVPNETTKRIIRLNINCRNFELMLIFYRLLFDKYSNFSKRHFSVFILYQTKSFELQLSLKYDENIEPYRLDGVSLIHYIESSNEFNHVLYMLNGLTSEIVPNRMYSVVDPDGNQIYLVDISRGPVTNGVCMARGLADVVFDELNSDEPSSSALSANSTFSMSSNDWGSDQTKILNNIIDSSSTNSETISLDSGRGSAHWSVFSENQLQKKLSRKRAMSVGNLHFKEKTNDNQYYDFCYRKISAAKALAQQRKSRQQQKENFNLQNIQWHLNTSSDEFEGLLSFKPNEGLRKAKSVSFVDKLDDDYDNSAINLNCLKRQNKTPIMKADIKSSSQKPYELLSETSSHVRNARTPCRTQNTERTSHLVKSYRSSLDSSQFPFQTGEKSRNKENATKIEGKSSPRFFK
jgi:hypothetical protein